MDGGLPLSAWATVVDSTRPPTRPGGVRSRPLNVGMTCVVRVPSLSADVRLDDEPALAEASSSDAPATDSPLLRAHVSDSLSSIGLPGEEAATFVPLVIEPYNPPTVSPPARSPSSGSGPPAQMSPSAASPTPSFVSPRPPAGAAVPRAGSGRRSIWRQPSQHTAAQDTGNPSPPTSSAPTAPLKVLSVMVAAAAAATSPTVTTAATPVESPSAAAMSLFPVGDLPVVVFDPSTVLANEKATAAYLDPSKPAVRRLLPPLLHTSQAFVEDAVLNAVPSGSMDSSSTAVGSASRSNTANGTTAASTGAGVCVSSCAAANRSAVLGALAGSGTPSPSGTCTTSYTTSCTTGSPGLHGYGDVDECLVAAPADSLLRTPPCEPHESPPPALRRSLRLVESLRSSIVGVDSVNDTSEVDPPPVSSAAIGGAGAGSDVAAPSAPCSAAPGCSTRVRRDGAAAAATAETAASGPAQEPGALGRGLDFAGGAGSGGGAGYGAAHASAWDEMYGGPGVRQHQRSVVDGDDEEGASGGVPEARDQVAALRAVSEVHPAGLAQNVLGSGQSLRLDLARLPSRHLLGGGGREALSPTAGAGVGGGGSSGTSPRGAGDSICRTLSMSSGTSRPSTAALPPILSRSSIRRQTSSQ